MPTSNPKGEHICNIEKTMNETICIPAWWHNVIIDVGQKFECAKEVMFALMYFSIANKFVYDFVKNKQC